MYMFQIWSIYEELDETSIFIIFVFFIKRDAESPEKLFHFSYKFTLYIHIQEQIRSFLSRSNYKILSRSHTLFLLDILVSFELRVHSIDSCSCTKIDANHYFCRLKSIYACATSLSTDFNTIGHNKFLLPINGQCFLRFFLILISQTFYQHLKLRFFVTFIDL